MTDSLDCVTGCMRPSGDPSHRRLMFFSLFPSRARILLPSPACSGCLYVSVTCIAPRMFLFVCLTIVVQNQSLVRHFFVPCVLSARAARLLSPLPCDAGSVCPRICSAEDASGVRHPAMSKFCFSCISCCFCGCRSIAWEYMQGTAHIGPASLSATGCSIQAPGCASG